MKTRKEIAQELGISTKTLRRWLVSKEINIPSRKYLNPEEYRLILSQFGMDKSSESSESPRQSSLAFHAAS